MVFDVILMLMAYQLNDAMHILISTLLKQGFENTSAALEAQFHIRAVQGDVITDYEKADEQWQRESQGGRWQWRRLTAFWDGHLSIVWQWHRPTH